MVTTAKPGPHPLNLVITGEAEVWAEALKQIVGPQWVQPHCVANDRELLEVVQSGDADAVVLDDEAKRGLDVLQVLRMLRRLDDILPVVILTRRRDRRWLESALNLAVFSVVVKPLALEELLQQISRMMVRLDRTLREDR